MSEWPGQSLLSSRSPLSSPHPNTALCAILYSILHYSLSQAHILTCNDCLTSR